MLSRDENQFLDAPRQIMASLPSERRYVARRREVIEQNHEEIKKRVARRFGEYYKH